MKRSPIRFDMMLSLDNVGMWLVIDTYAIYRDSQPMSCHDACDTMEWLNEAHLDGRLRTPWTEFDMGDWEAEE